jgi:DNA ligase D-like protein (predicted ligase)
LKIGLCPQPDPHPRGRSATRFLADRESESAWLKGLRNRISRNLAMCIAGMRLHRYNPSMASKSPKGGSASFIETMDCLPAVKIPEGPEWTYEIKLDGYRLEAVKRKGSVTLFSRRKNVLNQKFGYIAEALADLPDETVLDGELVGLDEQGISSFNLLQNFKSAATQIHYYVFDVLMWKGRSLLDRPLHERREILTKIVPRNDHIGVSVVDTRTALAILKFVKLHGLEGVIAKRADSKYEPGKRSGLWTKTRINLGQEFVVGGYTPGNPFDALIVGFYDGKDLLFAARVRAGFVPATRREVFAQIKSLKTSKCPFVNLPESAPGRWGQGLTAEKMKSCFWVKPEVVVRIDFAEWTGADKLRHTKFVALRDDKDPRKVVRET